MLIYNNPAADLQLLDKRLIEIYGEEQCMRWKNESPAYLDYHAFELIQGHTVVLEETLVEGADPEELMSIDPVNFPVDEVAYENPTFFNPLRFNVKRSYLNRKYYRIGSTGRVLVLFSGEELRHKFEAK